MCKVFAMTNMAKVKIDAAFISAVRDAVCATGDDDGFGYAVLDATGSIYGERTTAPYEFEPLRPQTGKALDLPIVTVTQNQFGMLGTSPKAFIGHGRMSTNHVSLENTHPFVSDRAALIHNGVVQDENKVVTDLKTTCDTEILLKLFDAKGMDAIEQNASGYYAVAVLTTDGLLHIARDSHAPLYIAWSKDADSYLIATRPEIMQSIAAIMHWDLETPILITDNIYAIFDGNRLAEYRAITPIGHSRSIDFRQVSKSLGQASIYDMRSYEEYEYEEERLNSDDGPTDYIDIYDLYNRSKA